MEDLQIPPWLAWVAYLAGSAWPAPPASENAMWRIGGYHHDAAVELDALIPELARVRAQTQAVLAGATAAAAEQQFAMLFDGEYAVAKLTEAMRAIGELASQFGTAIQFAKLQILTVLGWAAGEITLRLANAEWTLGASTAQIPVIEEVAQWSIRRLMDAVEQRVMAALESTLSWSMVKRMVLEAAGAAAFGAGQQIGDEELQTMLGDRGGIDWAGVGASAWQFGIGGAAAGVTGNIAAQLLGPAATTLWGRGLAAEAAGMAAFMVPSLLTGQPANPLQALTGGLIGTLQAGLHDPQTHAEAVPDSAPYRFVPTGPVVEGSLVTDDPTPGAPRALSALSVEPGEHPLADTGEPTPASAAPADQTTTTADIPTVSAPPTVLDSLGEDATVGTGPTAARDNAPTPAAQNVTAPDTRLPGEGTLWLGGQPPPPTPGEQQPATPSKAGPPPAEEVFAWPVYNPAEGGPIEPPPMETATPAGASPISLQDVLALPLEPAAGGPPAPPSPTAAPTPAGLLSLGPAEHAPPNPPTEPQPEPPGPIAAVAGHDSPSPQIPATTPTLVAVAAGIDTPPTQQATPTSLTGTDRAGGRAETPPRSAARAPTIPTRNTPTTESGAREEPPTGLTTDRPFAATAAAEIHHTAAQTPHEPLTAATTTSITEEHQPPNPPEPTPTPPTPNTPPAAHDDPNTHTSNPPTPTHGHSGGHHGGDGGEEPPAPPAPHDDSNDPEILQRLAAINNEFRQPDGEILPERREEWARRVSQAYAEHQVNITPDQVRAIYNYGAAESGNFYLRNIDQLRSLVEHNPILKHHLDAWEDLVAHLDPALAALPPYRADPSDQWSITYRGVSVSDSVLAQMQVGSTFRDLGYLSTTTDEHRAVSVYGSKNVSEGETKIVITVVGRSGVYITPLSSFLDENEVLFPRGTEFEVLSRKRDPADGMLRIEMREKTLEKLHLSAQQLEGLGTHGARVYTDAQHITHAANTDASAPTPAETLTPATTASITADNVRHTAPQPNPTPTTHPGPTAAHDDRTTDTGQPPTTEHGDSGDQNDGGKKPPPPHAKVGMHRRGSGGHDDPPRGVLGGPVPDPDDHIGREIAKWRRAAGPEYTQKMLGAAIGRGRETISQYERGIVTPHPDIVHRIGRVLGVDPAEVDKALVDHDMSPNYADHKTIRRWLKIKRIMAHRSGEEVSIALGRTPDYVSNFELARGEPRPAVVRAIGEELGIDLAEVKGALVHFGMSVDYADHTRAGKWLKALRIDKGWSQSDVANKAGYKYDADISDIETGDPSPDDVRAVANALGVSDQDVDQALIHFEQVKPTMTPLDRHTIGDWVAQKREARGWTPERLSAAIDYIQFSHQIENGEVVPRPDTVRAIGNVLGIDPAETEQALVDAGLSVNFADHTDVRQWLWALRIDNDWTQEDLDDAISHLQPIRTIEAGTTAPRIETVCAIARQSGVLEDELAKALIHFKLSSDPDHHDKAGRWLWVRRDLKGWSIEQLENASGVSNDSLTHIEQGRQTPRAVTLRRIAAALEVDHETIERAVRRFPGR